MAARAARLPSVVLTLAAPPASEPGISIGCFKVKQGKIMSNRILSMLFAFVILAGGSLALSSCGFGQKSESVKSQSQAGPQGGPGQGGQGGPRLGQKAMGGTPVDKSGDKKLQALVKEVVPKFRQLVYVDATCWWPPLSPPRHSSRRACGNEETVGPVHHLPPCRAITTPDSDWRGRNRVSVL